MVSIASEASGVEGMEGVAGSKWEQATPTTWYGREWNVIEL